MHFEEASILSSMWNSPFYFNFYMHIWIRGVANGGFAGCHFRWFRDLQVLKSIKDQGKVVAPVVKYDIPYDMNEGKQTKL